MNYSWYKCEAIEVSKLKEGSLTEVDVAGRRVGLLKLSGVIKAFTAACPHAGGSLCNGWVDALGRIVCPDHKYRFDATTGRNTSGEGYKLFTYPIQIIDDIVFVGFIDI